MFNDKKSTCSKEDRTLHTLILIDDSDILCDDGFWSGGVEKIIYETKIPIVLSKYNKFEKISLSNKLYF